jgi:hypothetical protein
MQQSKPQQLLRRRQQQQRRFYQPGGVLHCNDSPWGLPCFLFVVPVFDLTLSRPAVDDSMDHIHAYFTARATTRLVARVEWWLFVCGTRLCDLSARTMFRTMFSHSHVQCRQTAVVSWNGKCFTYIVPMTHSHLYDIMILVFICERSSTTSFSGRNNENIAERFGNPNRRLNSSLLSNHQVLYQYYWTERGSSHFA